MSVKTRTTGKWSRVLGGHVDGMIINSEKSGLDLLALNLTVIY